MSEREIVEQGVIRSKIYIIRGKRVILDSDLAQFYGVRIKRLNEQVKRNIKRFPEDFMFQLTESEYCFLRSQFATLKNGRGKHRKYLPHVFTEQGIAMLSAVLNSDIAINVSIQIMRVFTHLRKMLETHADLKKKIEAMERKYDQQFRIVFEAIKQLLKPAKHSNRIVEGFKQRRQK